MSAGIVNISIKVDCLLGENELGLDERDLLIKLHVVSVGHYLAQSQTVSIVQLHQPNRFDSFC